MKFYGPTERVEKLKDKFWTYMPNVDPERAVVYDRMFKQSDELKDEPLIVARAKAYAAFLEERTIYIEDDQKIVGSFGRKPRAFPIYPETTGDDMVKEYRKLPTRDIDRFDYDEDVQETLEELLPRWHDSSLRRQVFPQLSHEERSLFLMDPEDIVNGTNIFSLDVPLNGPAGHITPDWQAILNTGFEAIIERAEERLKVAEEEGDQRGINFLRAAIITNKAMINFAQRYSKLAKEMAEKETDENRKAELLEIAEITERVPAKPARTLHEALQALWFGFVGVQMEGYQRCFSLGRFDQYMYPFLKADLEANRLNEEEAQELLDLLWLKFPETNYINSEYYSQIASGFPSQQQCVVGGQTLDGKDASNPLSYMCIQAQMNTLMHQPVLTVRYFEDTPDSLIKKAAELARMGTGHPSFFNDKRCVASLVRKGIDIEDARDYSSVGCAGIQPTRKDKGTQNAGYINFASALDFALNDGYWKHGDKQMGLKTGDPRDFETFEEMEEAFEKQLAMLLEVYSDAIVRLEKAHQELVPTPFISTFIQDCIGNARDRSDGGALINSGMSPRAIGFADVADSLAAIKELVFEKKVLTMDRLMDALDADFEGYEDVRQMLKTKAPKFGNDETVADEVGQRIVDIYVKESDKHTSLFGGKFHPGFNTVSSNVPYGKVVPALPNGRKAWEPLTDGVSPSHGVDKHGPTAVAQSVGKLDHDGMSGGSILNVKFNPSTIEDEEGLDRFTEYIRGALDSGVWHMQFNVVDAETLKDAQVHPEKHDDLIVRVAGYSAFFTGVGEGLQNDIIGRTEHTVS